MRLFLGAVAGCCLLAASMAAQETTTYQPTDNPLQGEYAFAYGEPVTIMAAAGGMGFDSITISPQDEVRAGDTVRCEVLVQGRNLSDEKLTVSIVMLLEEESGAGLERVTVDPFRVRGSRTFEETERVRVTGDALLAAAKVYVFAQVE